MNNLENEFLIEAQEMLEEAESSFVSLEKGGDFNINFNKIFRSFHSLKGAAGMFGLEKVQTHMHYLESLLEKYKIEKSFPRDVIDYFLKGIDATKDLLDEKAINFPKIEDFLSSNNAEIGKKESSPIEEVKSEPSKVTKESSNDPTYFAFVVDDESDIVDILSSFLEESGFKVKSFLKADELVQALKKHHPDVILSDINMPGLSGLEMAKIVSAIRPNLPIIFISAYVTKETILEGLGSGVSGFIDKPFKQDNVINQARSAAKKYHAFKLLNRSIDLQLYQFSDLEKYLVQIGKTSVRDMMKMELNNILAQRKLLFNK